MFKTRASAVREHQGCDGLFWNQPFAIEMSLRGNKLDGSAIVQGLRQFVYRIDNGANEPVVERFLRAHPVVAIGIFSDALNALTGLLRDDAVYTLARFYDFKRMNLNILCIPTPH